MLCILNLTWARLDDQAMAQMVLGNWPNLTKLILSGNLLKNCSNQTPGARQLAIAGDPGFEQQQT